MKIESKVYGLDFEGSHEGVTLGLHTYKFGRLYVILSDHIFEPPDGVFTTKNLIEETRVEVILPDWIKEKR